MTIQSGHRPSPAEIRSWERSLPVLARDLVQAGLHRVEVLLEHHLPLTSKRADVVLAGRHPRTKGPSYVVLELKQWSRAATWQGDPDLIVVDGAPGAPRLHPVLQVRGYCEYMVDFLKTLNGDPDSVAGAVYLHNATSRDAVASLYELAPDRHGRLFTADRRSEFLTFLVEHLDPAVAGAPDADALLGSAVAPSRQLLAVAATEVRDREQFTLLAEQRLAYSLVLHEVERAARSDGKSVIVITGGPGSGKSVIALSLLGELARRGRTVLHATGSRSFTQTLRKVVGLRAPRVQRLFKYFNQFMDAERNGVDVLILDEAHRIRETSVDRYTRAELRTDRLQVDELIAAARVPVFLLDEHQVVRPGEQGTVAAIESQARSLGLPVRRVSLDGQFRCGGSAAYVSWVVELLGLSHAGPRLLEQDPAFQVAIADSAQEMEALLEARLADGYGARISAGYCWPWSDPRPDGSLVDDVVLGEWSRPWNLKGDRSVGGAPPAALWATDPAGFDQVGCIYTAQGFEYDWSGVVMGPDLVWRDGAFVSRREYNRDPDFRNRERVSDSDFDRLVRNVYKVLLTRGMVGTVLYSTDHETRKALRELCSSRNAATLPN